MKSMFQTAIWHWLGDDGEWIPYADDCSQKLESQFLTAFFGVEKNRSLKILGDTERFIDVDVATHAELLDEYDTRELRNVDLRYVCGMQRRYDDLTRRRLCARIPYMNLSRERVFIGKQLRSGDTPLLAELNGARVFFRIDAPHTICAADSHEKCKSSMRCMDAALTPIHNGAASATSATTTVVASPMEGVEESSEKVAEEIVDANDTLFANGSKHILVVDDVQERTAFCALLSVDRLESCNTHAGGVYAHGSMQCDSGVRFRRFSACSDDETVRLRIHTSAAQSFVGSKQHCASASVSNIAEAIADLTDHSHSKPSDIEMLADVKRGEARGNAGESFRFALFSTN